MKQSISLADYYTYAFKVLKSFDESTEAYDIIGSLVDDICECKSPTEREVINCGYAYTEKTFENNEYFVEARIYKDQLETKRVYLLGKDPINFTISFSKFRTMNLRPGSSGLISHLVVEAVYKTDKEKSAKGFKNLEKDEYLKVFKYFDSKIRSIVTEFKNYRDKETKENKDSFFEEIRI